MFEDFSPEAQQMHAHNHTTTYTYMANVNGIGITNDGMWRVSEAVSNKFHYSVQTEIEKLDHTKETIYTDNLKVIEDSGIIKLVNDKDECIEIYNVQETGRKVFEMIDKASDLPVGTPMDRAFKKQLLEFLKECGFYEKA